MNEIDFRLAQIFMPQYLQRAKVIQNNHKKLVHYTSASSALSILKNKEIWMRNTTCMNDFSEVRYGVELFQKFRDDREKYKNVMEAFGKHKDVFENAMDKILKDYQLTWTNMTYICCFSEHDEEDDRYGRLSMWRGYGTDSSVALVMKPDSFINENPYYQIYTSPVEYLNESQFNNALLSLSMNIQKEKKFLESLKEEVVLDWIIRMIKFAVTSIKHPGFKEEKEWRVIADYETCKGLKQDIEIVNGMPQMVMKLPLTYGKVNSENGFSIPANLDHLIIGPTLYPAVIGKALEVELENCKVDEPWTKIKFSEIPYRARV